MGQGQLRSNGTAFSPLTLTPIFGDVLPADNSFVLQFCVTVWACDALDVTTDERATFGSFGALRKRADEAYRRGEAGIKNKRLHGCFGWNGCRG